MSDIRLHTLRRSSNNENNYTRLHPSADPSQPQYHRQHESTSALGSGSRPGLPMPLRTPLYAGTAAAVISSSSSARRKRGRRRDDYDDGEPEEEATLLGESERDPGFLHDEEDRPIATERPHGSTSQVRAEMVIPSPFMP